MPEPIPPHQEDPRGGRGEGPVGPKLNRGMLAWVLFIVLAMLLLTVFYQKLDHRQEISADQFWTYAKRGDVAEVLVKDKKIEGVLRAGVEGRKVGSSDKFVVNYDYTADKEFLSRLQQSPRPITINFDTGGEWWSGMLMQVLVWGLVLLLLWFFVFRQLRGAGGGAGILGNFGRSRHRVTTKEHTNVTFDDVAGIEEAKEEVARDHRVPARTRGSSSGWAGAIPRGVLLVGEPGCGKTLLAKAIAGEADVPFFSISGSDFVEMFVGVGRQPRPRPVQAGQGHPPRASSSWTRSTPSAGAAARASTAAGTTSASRRSTPSWWRWTASTPPTR